MKMGDSDDETATASAAVNTPIRRPQVTHHNVTNNYAAPVLLFPSKFRRFGLSSLVCGSLSSSRLNNATVADKYPVPNIQDFTNRLAGSHMFSKLDLVKGYYQIPMVAADIPKMAVITPFGMYEFLVMPFGLCNAEASFQRILSGLPFVFVYLDDVLIASPDQDLHLGHLRQVLDLFRLHGLTTLSSSSSVALSQAPPSFVMCPPVFCDLSFELFFAAKLSTPCINCRTRGSGPRGGWLRFLWPGMNSDLAFWARSCLDCQRARIVRHVKPPVHVIPVPSQRFSHVHVDLVGPLRSSNRYTHLFTIIDQSTRLVEAVPMTSTTAKACADALFSSWVAWFGVPALITSDRGPEFAGSVWSQLCLLLGIKQLMTTAYHPQANGLVERFHRSLKNSLRARLASDQWFWHLPLVLLGLRVVPRDVFFCAVFL